MIRSLERRQVERFRDIILERVGFVHDESKLEELSDLLRQRAAQAGEGVDLYLDRLVSLPERDPEMRALVAKITVGETFFFRYGDHFRAFANAVLPAIAARGQRRLHILSAGCSSGEEPYSLAMVVRDTLADWQSWDIYIHAVDVNPEAIERARRGVYLDWSLRATPDVVKQGRFKAQGRSFALDPDVLSMVTFEERNLVTSDPIFWRTGVWDVVFCRNVLMYFSADVARGVLGRIHRALAPGGFLFLGHAETLRGVSDGFHLCHTHDTFYYRRRDASEKAIVFTDGMIEHAPQVTPPPPEVDGATSWIDAIHRASAAAVAASPPSHRETAEAPRVEPPTVARADLDRVFETMGEERFADALDQLHALPGATGGDPDALLLRAVLLANAHRVDEAAIVASELLDLDPMHAGAHYVLALCREHHGDDAGAIEHDQRAIYLDPTFAIPRLHLGLLAKRIGDRTLSRQELGHALLLLQREEASRILVFGGGFRRDALIALCRSELAASGARA